MSNDDKRTLNDFFPDLERRPQKFIDAERMVNNLESSESAWDRISYLLENNLVNREEIIKRKHYLFELLKLKSKIQLESAGRKSRRELLNDQLSSFVDLLSCADKLAEIGLIRKEEYEHLWRVLSI